MKSTAHFTIRSTIRGKVLPKVVDHRIKPDTKLRGLNTESGLHDLMEHRDTLEIEWNSDKSAVQKVMCRHLSIDLRVGGWMEQTV